MMDPGGIRRVFFRDVILRGYTMPIQTEPSGLSGAKNKAHGAGRENGGQNGFDQNSINKKKTNKTKNLLANSVCSLFSP